MNTVPWSQELCQRLNAHQQDPSVHPYTCATSNCGEIVDCLDWQGKPHEVFFRSVLTATTNGWRCDRCNYTQNWCH